MEKLTNEIALKRSKEVWGDFYDYSLFNYINARTHIKLICKKHGLFKQMFSTHLKSICYECSKDKKRNTESSIIENFNKVHNGIYDYSKTKYCGFRKNIIVICKIHDEFEINAANHKNGRGCRKCSIDSQKIKLEDFIKKSNDIHNYIYDYSNVEYLNNHTKVKIICKIHGEFEISPSSHIKKYGCQECLLEEKVKIKYENWVKKCNLYHNNLYDYSKVEYLNNQVKVKIICKKHGDFYQEPRIHLTHGCMVCRESKGEKEVAKMLDSNNILYIREYKFEDCTYIKKLPFDFFLPELNICIEYNGIQHYEPVNHFGGVIRYDEQIIKDNIKRDFCKNKNIYLLEINNIKEIKNKIEECIKGRF
jgi:hypothetical protein